MSDLGLEMPVFFDPSEAPGPGVFDGADVTQASIFGGGMGMVEENPLFLQPKLRQCSVPLFLYQPWLSVGPSTHSEIVGSWG